MYYQVLQVVSAALVLDISCSSCRMWCMNGHLSFHQITNPQDLCRWRGGGGGGGGGGRWSKALTNVCTSHVTILQPSLPTARKGFLTMSFRRHKLLQCVFVIMTCCTVKVFPRRSYDFLPCKASSYFFLMNIEKLCKFY